MPCFQGMTVLQCRTCRTEFNGCLAKPVSFLRSYRKNSVVKKKDGGSHHFLVVHWCVAWS